MSTIQLESLTHMVFEIVEEKCLFDLSRSSEVKGQGRTTTKRPNVFTVRDRLRRLRTLGSVQFQRNWAKSS